MESDAPQETSHAAQPAAEPEDEAMPTAPAPPGAERMPDGQPVGADNIRDGTVRGLMGGPNQTQGEGQGG